MIDPLVTHTGDPRDLRAETRNAVEAVREQLMAATYALEPHTGGLSLEDGLAVLQALVDDLPSKLRWTLRYDILNHTEAAAMHISVAAEALDEIDLTPLDTAPEGS